MRSTVFDLTDCFHSPEPSDEGSSPLNIGRVDYLDYEKDLIPEHDLLYPFVHKRQSFGYESELRAVITHYPKGEDPDGGVTAEELREATPVDGLTVAVDVGQLIQAVHVSPTAPHWFFELVSSVVEPYEISAKVVQSSLAEEPLF